MTFQSKEDYINHCWDSGREYCEGVVRSTIICNQNIRLAVQRFQTDLKRLDLEYNTKAVDRVFSFFSYLNVERGKRFILQPFQAFIIMSLFGFYYSGTDERKYQYAFLFMGRKNGKTTFVAALQLYFLMADGCSYPRSILISASQTNSKDTGFATLEEIIKYSPAIRRRLEVMKSNVVRYREVDGERKLGWSKTTVMDTKKLEGYNPTSCILDEIHTYKDAQKFNVIKNGLGTKKNPMLFLISTGGIGEESFCNELVELGRRVLRNEVEDDKFFYLLYELDEGDDWHNESNWYKVNPGLGTILHKNKIIDDYQRALILPSSRQDFLTKRLNMFLNENTQWLDNEVLISGFKNFSEETVKDLPCYIGLDLSSTRDLTSIVCLWDAGDKVYVKPYFFFVKNNNNSLRKGNIDITKWVDEGDIITCSTPTIDYALVIEYLKDINNKNNVQGLFYDPWRIEGIKKEVDAEGIWCQPIPPRDTNYDPSVRELERFFYENKIDIYPNKCMVWNFRNVVIHINRDGNMRPDKNKSADAIDGVVSLLFAICGYLRAKRGISLI